MPSPRIIGAFQRRRATWYKRSLRVCRGRSSASASSSGRRCRGHVRHVDAKLLDKLLAPLPRQCKRRNTGAHRGIRQVGNYHVHLELFVENEGAIAEAEAGGANLQRLLAGVERRLARTQPFAGHMRLQRQFWCGCARLRPLGVPQRSALRRVQVCKPRTQMDSGSRRCLSLTHRNCLALGGMRCRRRPSPGGARGIE